MKKVKYPSSQGPSAIAVTSKIPLHIECRVRKITAFKLHTEKSLANKDYRIRTCRHKKFLSSTICQLFFSGNRHSGLGQHSSMQQRHQAGETAALAGSRSRSSWPASPLRGFWKPATIRAGLLESSYTGC